MSSSLRRWTQLAEPCADPGCDRPARSLGLCDSHYRQHRAHGRTFRLARYQRSSLTRSTTSSAARAELARRGEAITSVLERG